ncbi:neprilysin-4 isoform X1 [Bemisia tabaci]|uniref:neprilysin-4 isoform X1 n=1 Tax=Bemisia tabaci TaxID=7038 RepID=UPI003B27C9D4
MNENADTASNKGTCLCCKLEVSENTGRLHASSFVIRWCGSFDNKRTWRQRRMKLILLFPFSFFIIISIAFLCCETLKMVTPDLLTPPQPVPMVVSQYDADLLEHTISTKSDLLEDLLKTKCIPSSSYFTQLRKKRELRPDTLGNPKYGTYQSSVSSDPISQHKLAPRWFVSSESLPLLKENDIIPKSQKLLNSTTKSIQESDEPFDATNQEQNQDPSENSEKAQEAATTVPNYIDQADQTHDSSPDIQNAENIDWVLKTKPLNFKTTPAIERENQTEEIQRQKPTVLSTISDSVPAIQHAFWKGEGTKNMILEMQGKLMRQYMDTDADPCQDFYQYSCGNWGRLNPIPQDKAAFDTFEMLRESLDSVLKELLEAKPLPDEAESHLKAKNLYSSCINYEVLAERAEKPLIDLLDKLGGWPILRPGWDASSFDWIAQMAQLRSYNNDILISEWVGPDIKNSDEYIIQFDQTSLGLPTRDYYLQSSNLIYLAAYRNYLIKIATLLGASPDNVTAQADEIISFEIDLAEITSAPDERRNVSELYRRLSVAELSSLVPEIDWQRYLSIVLNRPCNASEPVVIFALRYVQDLVVLLAKTPPRTISNYLLWRFVRHRVNNLDDRFQEVKQRFYFILFGREKAPPRWKNCVAQVNSNMGMALGAMFVKRYFDENSKDDTLVMTKEIQQAFQEILNETTWIDIETKKLASEKIDAMMLRIGYPNFILDKAELNHHYKDVEIESDKYFENTLNILQHLTRVEQSHLGTPVNKSQWWNSAPAIVNAYYSRNKNQIMFPAGILQPPFYHRHFPRSLNYGGIGVVIGHEITHGFDDKGRLFDKSGNLHRWWKDEAISNFHEKALCLIEQYSKYVVSEVSMQIDGINTQGENIADNGGIKQAFRAYKKWLKTNNGADETLPGLNATGLQLFFLNFAQVWCGNTRPEATRNKLKTAVHSPGRFRVIGTLSNSKDFSEVFNCPLGSPMNPVKKCSVW